MFLLFRFTSAVWVIFRFAVICRGVLSSSCLPSSLYARLHHTSSWVVVPIICPVRRRRRSGVVSSGFRTSPAFHREEVPQLSITPCVYWELGGRPTALGIPACVPTSTPPPGELRISRAVAQRAQNQPSTSPESSESAEHRPRELRISRAPA